MEYRNVGLDGGAIIKWIAGLGLAGVLAATAAAQSAVYTPDEKAVVSFSTNWDTGIGREVFVVGNHADLGDWNPVAARKLRWTSGNVWTGAIAISAGHDLEYKYIVRTNTGAAYCADNVVWMPGPNLATAVPARADAPYTAKTLYYYSGWTNAFLLHRTGSDTNWTHTPMQRIGEGRSPGESLYRLSGIGKAGELLTFVPNGYFAGVEYWDNTPIAGVPDYFTRLDAFVLQDGHIYSYWPPVSRTPSAIATNFVASSYTPQAPSRNIRVYTPRNYSQNPHKRYPVLYLHDGQNVFRPGGIYGCWFAEDAADDMISLGLMRETILVAIDNTGERMREYIPPTDAPDGPGTADRYLAYVAHNVKPFVDLTYRTLADREHTGVLGSSFGGVASLYFGLSTNLFGKIGPMSTSFWAIPNYLDQRVYGQDTSGLRIYTDFGTAEQEVSFQGMWSAYTKFLADGYVPNDTVRIEVGCGQAHNEPAWASRVHMPMTFLFNAREEANEILRREAPPQMEIQSADGDLTFTYVGFKGWNNVLQRTPQLSPAGWQDVATGRVDHLMWAGQELTHTPPGGPGGAFYRIESRVPAP